jgi:hypothetical protein
MDTPAGMVSSWIATGFRVIYLWIRTRLSVPQQPGAEASTRCSEVMRTSRFIP